MRLFHVSDNPQITQFEPRPVNTDAWPSLSGKYVWAISDEMVHNYYFPRFCPRVCRMIGPKTTEIEKDLFRKYGMCKSIIYVEKKRRNELESCVLYRYEFDTSNFYPIDYTAGYYISEKTEFPIEKTQIDEPLEKLRMSNVKVVYVSNLLPYRQQNAESHYRSSNIRMAYLEEA